MRGTPLSVDQIVKVKKLLIANYGRTIEIANAVGVSTGSVSAIATGKRHADVFVRGFDRLVRLCEWNRKPKVKFMRRIKVDSETWCWNWTGSIGPTGYALANSIVPGEQRGSRVSYRLYNGEIPDGKYVLHTCHNRSCVNPDHLYLGTQKQNVADAIGVGSHVSMRKSGTEVKRGKLSVAQVIAARKRYAAGESQPSIAADFGVSRSAILDAVNGHTWKHIKEGLDA